MLLIPPRRPGRGSSCRFKFGAMCAAPPGFKLHVPRPYTMMSESESIAGRGSGALRAAGVPGRVVIPGGRGRGRRQPEARLRLAARSIGSLGVLCAAARRRASRVVDVTYKPGGPPGRESRSSAAHSTRHQRPKCQLEDDESGACRGSWQHRAPCILWVEHLAFIEANSNLAFSKSYAQPEPSPGR
jgi:hypothetical protein